MDEQEIAKEILKLQKTNNRNKIVILALMIILAFVIVITIYIRFFG